MTAKERRAAKRAALQPGGGTPSASAFNMGDAVTAAMEGNGSEEEEGTSDQILFLGQLPFTATKERLAEHFASKAGLKVAGTCSHEFACSTL